MGGRSESARHARTIRSQRARARRWDSLEAVYEDGRKHINSATNSRMLRKHRTGEPRRGDGWTMVNRTQRAMHEIEDDLGAELERQLLAQRKRWTGV